MKRVIRLLIGAGFAGATLIATTAGPAGAVADVDAYELTCSTFTGSGTATTPWVTVEVYDNVAEEDLVFELVTVAEDGTFSFDVSWIPPSVEGTSIYIGVWGSPLEEVGDWDGEDYFESDEIPCQPAPTTTTTTAAPVTTTTAAPAVADAAVVAPSFTG